MMKHQVSLFWCTVYNFVFLLLCSWVGIEGSSRDLWIHCCWKRRQSTHSCKAFSHVIVFIRLKQIDWLLSAVIFSEWLLFTLNLKRNDHILHILPITSEFCLFLSFVQCQVTGPLFTVIAKWVTYEEFAEVKRSEAMKTVSAIICVLNRFISEQ